MVHQVGSAQVPPERARPGDHKRLRLRCCSGAEHLSGFHQHRLEHLDELRRGVCLRRRGHGCKDIVRELDRAWDERELSGGHGVECCVGVLVVLAGLLVIFST